MSENKVDETTKGRKASKEKSPSVEYTSFSDAYNYMISGASDIVEGILIEDVPPYRATAMKESLIRVIKGGGAIKVSSAADNWFSSISDGAFKKEGSRGGYTTYSIRD